MTSILTFIRSLPQQLILYVILAVIILITVIGGFFYIRHLGVAAEEQRQKIAGLEEKMKEANATIAAAGVQLNRYDELSRGLEGQLAEARQKQQELNGKLKNEIAKQPVYRDCRVPADGVRLLRDAQAAARPGTR